MADTQRIRELEQALLKADEANDAEAAQALANEILRLRAEPAKGQQVENAPPSTMSRKAGLTTRAAIQAAPGAVFGIPALATDAFKSFSNLVNMGITNPALAKFESLTGIETPRTKMYRPMETLGALGQAGQMLADVARTPQPVTPGEKMFVSGGTAVLEAAGLGGIGRLLSRAPSALGMVGRELSAAPIMSPIAAGTGATSAEYVRQEGGSPMQQTAAGLLGGLAPAALAGIGPATVGGVRRVVRGPNAQAMQRNIAEMQSQNIPVSVGTTSESARARMLEGALVNTPTGRQPILAQRQAESEAIGRQVDDMVKILSFGGTDTMKAGTTITAGIQDVYIPRAKQLSRKLYERVDQTLKPTTPINLPSFTRALKELTVPTRGAERVSGQFINPFLKQLSDNIAADLGVANLSRVSSVKPAYSLVADLRSRIGSKLADSGLIADVPRGELKRLYNALMNDLEAGLANSPDALRELRRANGFTRSLHAKVDDILDPVTGQKVPEKVFNSVMQNTEEGGTALRSVMGSLQPEQRKIVAATIINRLGRARPSQQTPEGDLFSVETFLTRWNQLSPTTKKQVTDQFPDSMKASFDTLTKAMGRIREVNASMPNPSGTGPNTAFVTMMTGLAAGVGNFVYNADPTILAATGAVAGGLNVSSRLMTSPKFVNWLAQQTKLPANATSGQLALLNSMFQKEEDEDLKAEVGQFINSVQQQ